MMSVGFSHCSGLHNFDSRMRKVRTNPERIQLSWRCKEMRSYVPQRVRDPWDADCDLSQIKLILSKKTAEATAPMAECLGNRQFV